MLRPKPRKPSKTKALATTSFVSPATFHHKTSASVTSWSLPNSCQILSPIHKYPNKKSPIPQPFHNQNFAPQYQSSPRNLSLPWVEEHFCLQLWPWRHPGSMGPRHPSASHWKLETWITYGPSSKECSASKGCTASHPTPTPLATLRFVCWWCVHPPPKNWSNHRCHPLRQNCVKTAEVVPLFISILLYIISIYCTWYRCISLFLFSFTWFYGPCFTHLLAAALQRMGLLRFFAEGSSG